MKSKEPNWMPIIQFILVVLIILLMGAEVVVWVKYGNKPISEIPVWALWFMFNRGK